MKRLAIILSLIVLLISCNSTNKESNESLSFVYGTQQDMIEPWLALRDSSSSCSNLIGKLPDDTKVKVIEGEVNNDYVMVEIKLKGYVNKNYLYKYSDISMNPKKILEKYTSEILQTIKRGGLSRITRFIKQDSIKIFYWELPKCSLNENTFKKLKTKIQTDEYSFIEYKGDELLNKLKKQNILKPLYKQKNYFPSAGFGGGSVLPPSKETHIVIVPLGKGDNSDKLWFEYSIIDNNVSLNTNR